MRSGLFSFVTGFVSVRETDQKNRVDSCSARAG